MRITCWRYYSIFLLITLLVGVALGFNRQRQNAEDQPSNNNCTFQTITQDTWGQTCQSNFPNGSIPPCTVIGCFRDQFWDSCFPNSTLSIGCNATSITFTNSKSISKFLPQSGDFSTPLLQSYFDPEETETGSFAGDVTALAMNINFDNCLPNFSQCPTLLKDLFMCDQLPTKRYSLGDPTCIPFFGWTIEQLYVEAQKVLGGCSNDQFTVNEVQNCVIFINTEFSYGRTLSETPFSTTNCTTISTDTTNYEEVSALITNKEMGTTEMQQERKTQYSIGISAKTKHLFTLCWVMIWFIY